VPQEPIKPNRPKILSMSFLLALAAGGGLTLLLEMLDTTIRRSTDLYGVMESYLIVSVPYIMTKREELRSKRLRRALVFAVIPALVGGLIVVYLLMPPLDLMIAKARVGLFR